MYIVRMQKTIMQTLKAGLVLYLHSKKDIINDNECKYTITIFLLNRAVLYIYDKASQATSCLLL